MFYYRIFAFCLLILLYSNFLHADPPKLKDNANTVDAVKLFEYYRLGFLITPIYYSSEKDFILFPGISSITSKSDFESMYKVIFISIESEDKKLPFKSYDLITDFDIINHTPILNFRDNKLEKFQYTLSMLTNGGVNFAKYNITFAQDTKLRASTIKDSIKFTDQDEYHFPDILSNSLKVHRDNLFPPHKNNLYIPLFSSGFVSFFDVGEHYILKERDNFESISTSCNNLEFLFPVFATENFNVFILIDSTDKTNHKYFTSTFQTNSNGETIELCNFVQSGMLPGVFVIDDYNLISLSSESSTIQHWIFANNSWELNHELYVEHKFSKLAVPIYLEKSKRLFFVSTEITEEISSYPILTEAYLTEELDLELFSP